MNPYLVVSDRVVAADDISDAVALARDLTSSARPTPAERRRMGRLGRLVSDPRARRFTLALTDELLRISDPSRAGAHLRELHRELRGSRALGPFDRAALAVGAHLSRVAPRPVLALVGWRVRREASQVVGPADGAALTRRLRRHRRNGFRVNVNLLGEAVLGEAEATARLEAIGALIDRSDVTHVSVKASAILSQINLVAFDDTVATLSDRLARLFRRAAAADPPVFVNVDMEERRDLHLTTAAFIRALSAPDLVHHSAGIVLQAYLPESLAVAEELIAWADLRVSRGGAPIKVRMVKGANLAMERVEAELRGWPEAPYSSKAATDASFRRVLLLLLDPSHSGVRVGVASHNVFDVALAHILATRLGTRPRLDIEMLDGMANPLARAVRDRLGPVLLYTPIVARGDFDSAIAYLARRLDENSAPDNHLRQVLVGEPGWFDAEAERFRASSALMDAHGAPGAAERAPAPPTTGWRNEPDTDLAEAPARDAILAAIAAHRAASPVEIPIVIDGARERRRDEAGTDPSDPTTTRYWYAVADKAAVQRARATARSAMPGWEARGAAERGRLLDRVADVMGADRASTIAVMALDAGKTVVEADPEVSEAVDFARYYGRLAATTERWGASAPRGVVVVASPWNFPYAIPAGGVLAALAAGNAVILKPAPETVWTAWVLAEQCWRAGIPTDVLQFVPCRDDDVGRELIAGAGTDAVILTGAHDTAMRFRTWRPDLHLLAETSGKNALVITETADLDQAIKDLVRSAFGHAGQKCSAASLAIVEDGVYDDPAFARRLVDAVASLRVGPAWEPTTVVGPLIRPPEGALLRALTELEPGERWLLEPAPDRHNPNLWTPGIKAGVAAGTPFHLEECFGPVLGVMRADDLAHAIELQNAPPYGLTGGLHSLSAEEVAAWIARVEVGNAYVNRTTTGAIVRRQPFGGWKRSVVGPTAKAGGPSYLAALRRWPERAEPVVGVDDGTWSGALQRLRAEPPDPSGLVSEVNGLRYVARGRLWLRVGPGVAPATVAAARAASAAVGVDVTVSDGESEDAFVARLRDDPRPVRALGTIGSVLRDAAAALPVELDDTPVAACQRVELLRWLREQTVSVTRHRHGNPSDALLARVGLDHPVSRLPG